MIIFADKCPNFRWTHSLCLRVGTFSKQRDISLTALLSAHPLATGRYLHSLITARYCVHTPFWAAIMGPNNSWWYFQLAWRGIKLELLGVPHTRHSQSWHCWLLYGVTKLILPAFIYSNIKCYIYTSWWNIPCLRHWLYPPSVLGDTANVWTLN